MVSIFYRDTVLCQATKTLANFVVLDVYSLESEGYYGGKGLDKRTDDPYEIDRFTDMQADEIIKTHIHPISRLGKWSWPCKYLWSWRLPKG